MTTAAMPAAARPNISRCRPKALTAALAGVIGAPVKVELGTAAVPVPVPAKPGHCGCPSEKTVQTAAAGVGVAVGVAVVKGH